MFMTGDLKDGVILHVLDHLGIPQGTYPESFVKIWPYLALKLNVTLKGGVNGLKWHCVSINSL